MPNHSSNPKPASLTPTVGAAGTPAVGADDCNVRQGKSLAAMAPLSCGDFVSNKQLVSNLLERPPDDVSLRDIAKEIEFISGVREGLAQLD